MSKPRTRGKGCLAAAIALLLIFAVITAAVVVVLNLTPNQIGIGDMPVIEHTTPNDLAVGDTKIKEIIRLILVKKAGGSA